MSWQTHHIPRSQEEKGFPSSKSDFLELWLYAKIVFLSTPVLHGWTVLDELCMSLGGLGRGRIRTRKGLTTLHRNSQKLLERLFAMTIKKKGAGATGLWYQLWLSAGKGNGLWKQLGNRVYLWGFRGHFWGIRTLFFFFLLSLCFLLCS